MASVYQAINAVQADIAQQGIGKSRTNTHDNYKFRGIDDVYNALSPLLAKHGLCILPRVLSRESVERVSQKGGALFYVTLDVEFDFISAEDGSKHTIRVFGEAMDRSDKATSKAMSAAYKYATFLVFAIPTSGDNDTEGSSHDVMPRSRSNGSAPRSAPPRSNGNGGAGDEDRKAAIGAINESGTIADLEVATQFALGLNSNPGWQKMVSDKSAARRQALGG